MRMSAQLIHFPLQVIALADFVNLLSSNGKNAGGKELSIHRVLHDRVSPGSFLTSQAIMTADVDPVRR